MASKCESVQSDRKDKKKSQNQKCYFHKRRIVEIKISEDKNVPILLEKLSLIIVNFQDDNEDDNRGG